MPTLGGRIGVSGRTGYRGGLAAARRHAFPNDRESARLYVRTSSHELQYT
jgi:hypothetical protein